MTVEILAESEVSLNAFIGAMKACAEEAEKRTANVELPPFPEATKLLARSDDDFQDDYKESGGTQAGLAEILKNWELRLRAHIREEWIRKNLPAVAKAAMLIE